MNKWITDFLYADTKTSINVLLFCIKWSKESSSKLLSKQRKDLFGTFGPWGVVVGEEMIQMDLFPICFPKKETKFCWG